MTKLRLRAKVNFPATVQGTGGIGVDKESGAWTINPQWEDLTLITTISSPETKELWVKDPDTDIYYRMSVDALVDALPTGPSGTVAVGTTTTLAGGANATVANSGTSTAAIFDFGIPAGRSAGWKYAWLTSTTNADPAAGNVKGNNATIASITNLYISETDGDANGIAAVLALLDDSTSTVKATIQIYDPVTPTNFAVFNVTGTITDNGTWDTIPVTYVANGGTLTNALAVRIWAALAGNKGADGAGTGDVVGPAASVDSELALFNSTTGKLIKRGSMTGLVKATSGVASAATSGTDYMAPGTTSLITIGFTVTPNNIGTVSSGTTTPALASGNYQYYTNNGAHTLAAPAADGAADILITNGASAGAITFSGFTVSSSPGDTLTTTNTNKFMVSIRRINSVSTYTIKALQ
jgi:hypothetical protein